MLNLIVQYNKREKEEGETALGLDGEKVFSPGRNGVLTQETFVRIYETRRRYMVQAKFSTWLFAIGPIPAEIICDGGSGAVSRFLKPGIWKTPSSLNAS